MYLVTDTYMKSSHFREVDDMMEFRVLHRGNEVAVTHLHLCEWMRQLEEAMRWLNIMPMGEFIIPLKDRADTASQEGDRMTTEPHSWDAEERFGNRPPEKPNYVQQNRNGHGTIDFFRGDRCIRTVIAGMTEKDSILLTGALNDAIEEGRQYETLLLQWEKVQG